MYLTALLVGTIAAASQPVAASATGATTSPEPASVLLGPTAPGMRGTFVDADGLHDLDLDTPAQRSAFEAACREWVADPATCDLAHVAACREGAVHERGGILYMADPPPGWPAGALMLGNCTRATYLGHSAGWVLVPAGGERDWVMQGRLERDPALHDRVRLTAERRPAQLRLLVETFIPKPNSDARHGQFVFIDPKTGAVTDVVPSGSITISGRPRPGTRTLACVRGTVDGMAQAWARLAAEEDEAVAAFALHAHELEAVDAPRALVDRARRARADEQRHRSLCLARAEAHAGGPVSLGPRSPSPPPRTRLADVLVGVAQEGCVNETTALAALLAAAEVAPPDDAAVLRRVAQDEAEHAALAWDTLAWGWPKLSATERHRVRRALAERVAVSAHSTLGRLDPDARRAVSRSAAAAVRALADQRLNPQGRPG